MDALTELQAWYAAQWEGDPPRDAGVRIESLDNPGWVVDISLEGTALAGVPFPEVVEVDAERDWIRCWVEGQTWRGVGGPRMLTRIVHQFLEWEAGHRPAAT